VNYPDFYNAELRAHHKHLRAAYGISPGNEVLDIGCRRRANDSRAAIDGALGDAAQPPSPGSARAHHRAEQGVVFESRSWLITARRSYRR
jgi:hypothetical protein